MNNLHCCYSEMYHANRWHVDFPAVMTTVKNFQLFVNDFVHFKHPKTGHTLGKVLKLYSNVSTMTKLIVKICILIDFTSLNCAVHRKF